MMFAIPSSPPQKKFKSYTTQFDDDVNCDQLNNNITNTMRAHRELDEVYIFSRGER